MSHRYEILTVQASLSEFFHFQARQMPRFADNDNGNEYTAQEIAKIQRYAQNWGDIVDSVKPLYWAPGTMSGTKGDAFIFGIFKSADKVLPYEVSCPLLSRTVEKKSLDKALEHLDEILRGRSPAKRPELHVV